MSEPTFGWAQTPGGGMLAKAIADAFARAVDHDEQAASDDTRKAGEQSHAKCASETGENNVG